MWNGGDMLKEIVKRALFAGRVCGWLLLAASGLITVHYMVRVFVTDRFFIPSESMYPTIEPGEYVYVNKLLYGPRLYTSFEFSEHAPLRCIRLPGLRRIRPGDIAAFNFPFGYDDWSRIEFRLNYVYCKRLAGTPGDVIGISDGIFWNGSVSGIIGVKERQMRLQRMSDSLIAFVSWYDAIPLSRPVWNVKNMGPLTVPGKGMTFVLDDFLRELYRHAIEYETALPADSFQTYTFRHDWYFALGDNSCDSKDSRFWGFVPDDFIIGIVPQNRKGRGK